jgi:hypothetical protein
VTASNAYLAGYEAGKNSTDKGAIPVPAEYSEAEKAEFRHGYLVGECYAD